MMNEAIAEMISHNDYEVVLLGEHLAAWSKDYSVRLWVIAWLHLAFIMIRIGYK